MKNKIKKIICITAAMILAFSAVVIPVSGASIPAVTYSVSSGETTHGQTFSVTLSLEECSSLKSIRVRPQYDVTVLELVSMEWLIEETSISGVDGGVAVAAYSTDRTDVSGDIIQCDFRVLSDAPIGDTDISFDTVLKSKANGTEEEISCNVQETLTIAIDHSFGDTIGGVKTCTVCGYVSNLRVGAANIDLGADITLNIKIRKDVFDGAGYTNPYVEVVRNGETLNLIDYTVDGNYYVFPYKNWAPYRMGDVFTAVVHGTLDGADVTGEEVFSYSVKQYVENQFTKYPDDATFRTLLVDLLVYGYQHQVYNNYNLDEPLTTSDVITAADIETYATAELHKTLEDNLKTAYTTIDNPTLTWKAATVVLESTIEMVLKFEKIDTTGFSVVFADADGNVIDTVTEFTADPNNANRLCAQTAKLTAVQLYDLVYVTAYKDGVAISNTVQYSVESYAARNLTNADVADLCIAMMKYGHSAEQYLYT